MSDTGSDNTLPDIRVITITLEGPRWHPVVDCGEDFDEYAVVEILRCAADALHDDLMAAILGVTEDDDEEETD